MIAGLYLGTPGLKRRVHGVEAVLAGWVAQTGERHRQKKENREMESVREERG